MESDPRRNSGSKNFAAMPILRPSRRGRFRDNPGGSAGLEKPIVASGRGGALDTVPFFGGVFYGATEEDAIARLEEMEDSVRPTCGLGAAIPGRGIHAPNVGGN